VFEQSGLPSEIFVAWTVFRVYCYVLETIK